MKKTERYFLEHVRGMLQMKQAVMALLTFGCAMVALATWAIAIEKAGSVLFWALLSSIVGIFAFATLQQYEKKAKDVDKELGAYLLTIRGEFVKDD